MVDECFGWRTHEKLFKMVQKYQSPVRVYKYPFELVMAAYEKRFPTCKMIPVFLGSEILSEETSEDGASQVIERRCKLNVDAPYILKKIVGVDYVYFIQKNSLDRRIRSLKIEAFNESFSSRVIINENCLYSVHPENPDWTCFEQTASLDVKSFFGFESTVEKLAMKQYSLNIKKGKEIIEYYINELLAEGIVYLPPFQNSLSIPQITTSSEVEQDGCLSTSPKSLELQHATTLSSSLIKEDSNFKLDTDYIERCLGELSPLQESRLVQLRKWVADAQKGKIPSDPTLLRFLRARDFNLDKSREMLCHSLIWRKKYQVDRILSTYNPPKIVSDYFPGGWHYYDKDGRPLYILRLGQMDVKGLLKSVGEEGILKLTLHICEEGLQKTEDATRQSGKPVSTWTCLVDLDGLNMRHLWRPGIRALLRIIEIVEANYPETMGRVLIVRTPRVFPILWTIVSTFIDENTRKKFLFYGGNDYQGPGGLVDYMDKDYIPDFLGGQCMAAIPEGGLVPKSLYMSEEDYERERSEDYPLCENSIYQSVNLGKGHVHEIVIDNNDKGSVICWDFDVLKQDVVFTVLRTKVPIKMTDRTDEASASSHTPLCFNTTHLTGAHAHAQVADPQATQLPGSLHLAAHQHATHIEKAWKEGVDYFRAEQPLVCHDGESIQGSHVTSHAGSYILQWKYHEPPHTHHTFDIIENLTLHKAKIMYYYEVLKSQEFSIFKMGDQHI